MATSRRATKKKADPVSPVRNPFHRHRVAISFDPEEGLTQQSFKDECDINQIVDLHHRTGIVNHVARGRPEYGDAPDTTLFEAALVRAEINSAREDGFEFVPPEPPEAPEEPKGEKEGAVAPEKEASLEADTAAEVDSSG